MYANANSFTAHNIRLDDGTLTLPSARWTMDRHPVARSVYRLLHALYPGGLEGKTIIDVGCLEGGYTTEFARLGMRATGLEVRESNYNNCLFVQSRVNLPNLQFIHGDANDIARYGRYDVFFMNGLLYHLEQPRRFLQHVGRNCGRALVIHTHVAFSHETEAARKFNLSESTENEGLLGRWFPEHGDLSSDELDRLKWSSWQNRRSFWIQKEYLLQLIRDVGFDLVFEQFDYMPDIIREMTDGRYSVSDRVMLVGIKSDAPVEQPAVSDELIRMREEVAALRRSTSWRVTAPLRALARALGR